MTRARSFTALAAAAITVAAALTPGPAAARPSTLAAAHHRGASSQVVLDWERTSIRTVYTEAASPVPVGTLYLGFTSLAMYDAVRSARARGYASTTAAAAVAAHDVLAEYFPSSLANLDADLATSLAGVPTGLARVRGMAIGAATADRLIASRVDDGRGDTTIVYSRPPAPGVWQPPATGMLAPWLGFVKPLVVRHFVHTAGPDPLPSAAYAADYDEVRLLGSAASTERTATETDTALFFNSNAATMLTESVLARLDSEPISLSRTARLFAAMHVAMTDSIIQCWRLKYDVGFWRPVQAVAGADTDFNDATASEAGWVSLLPTPPYADYVSGHASLTGPAAEVIRRMLGDDTELVLHSYNTGTDRTYDSLFAIEHDALNSRIWGGLHFRQAMDDGYRIAHATARRVLHTLR